MTNCRLQQSRGGRARGNPRGWHTAQPAGTHSEQGEEQRASPSSCAAPTHRGPRLEGQPHCLPPPRALSRLQPPHSPAARSSHQRSHVWSHQQKPTDTQHSLPLTPPKCHTNIYPQSHPHTNTHQLRLRRHPHRHSPGPNPTQTEEFGNS